MAITDKEKGVWGLDQVYNKINQGSIWEYTTNTYQLWGWGRDSAGQLGQNSVVNYGRSSPVQVGTESTWKAIGLGANDQYMTMATKTDGSLWTWGYNINGALGHNTGHLSGHLSSPTQIPGTWSDALFSGTGVSMATKTDGTLWLWGDGFGDGLTAQNNKTRYSSPVQVYGGGSTWGKTIGTLAGYSSIKTDGTLWTWGNNGYGKLGQNSAGDSRSSPVQIPGTNWSSLKEYSYATAAVKTDGTLWVWGYNAYGKLGLNNKTNYSSPIQIPGTWKDLTGGGMYNMGGFINTDNELYVMGDNEKGYLGQNNTVRYSSPVQIPGSWDQVGFAAYATMGIKTDGTAWVWGQTNEYGELGLNAGVNYSSPVQLPGTDWDKPQGGMLQMFALKKN